MFLKFNFFLLCFYFAGIYATNQFRFDYVYSDAAVGWFKLHHVPAPWNDARRQCHAENAMLASPETLSLRQAILNFVRQEPAVDTIHTGIHTTYANGVYTSIEGVPLIRLPLTWAHGEPNNYNNSEKCLAMSTCKGTMSDIKCTDVHPYVCYKKKTQDLHINQCGTHDPGYQHDSRTGSCYKFHRRPVIWYEAYMTCIAEGGYLAIINSAVESLVIRDIYANNPDNQINSRYPYHAAIGFHDYNDGGSWMTIHGQTLAEAGYNTWQPSEPNNGSQPGGEFCGVTHRDNGFLYDAPCGWVLPFICEMIPYNLQA